MKKILFSLLALNLVCSAAGQDIPVSADAAFIPKNLAYITHIDDAILQKIGCKYAITESATASQLLTLLSAARSAPPDASAAQPRFEVRNKIVFHFQDRNDISVEFSQKFLNQSYLQANWNAEPILLRNEVVEEVRAMVNRGGFVQLNKNASASCDAL
jgi:hypothetical protein